MSMDFNRVENQIKKSYEQEATQLFKEYQSMPDGFRNMVSFDSFLGVVVILRPGKMGLVKYIRRTMEEKSELANEEGSEKEVLVSGLQPTSKHEEDKN